MKSSGHARNLEAWRYFGEFPFRHGDQLPSDFSFERWFHLSRHTGVVADFHYPQRVVGPDACGNCEGTGMLLRVAAGRRLEEITCVLCQGTGSHQVWLERERRRIAQYDREQRNIRGGLNPDGSRRRRESGRFARRPRQDEQPTYTCPNCQGKRKVLTQVPDTDRIWNGQGFENRNFGTKKSWLDCPTCQGRGWVYGRG
jgi:hypothetical protein